MRRHLIPTGIPALFLTAAIGLAVAHAQSHQTGANSSLNKLAWLAGTWRQVDIDHPTEEQWGEPSKNAMLGMCRLGRDGETRTYELMVIEERDGKLIYFLRHFGRGLVDQDKGLMTFNVLVGEKNSVVFEGRDAKHPSRLTYSLTTPNRLSIILDRTRDGKSLHDEFHMKRND